MISVKPRLTSRVGSVRQSSLVRVMEAPRDAPPALASSTPDALSAGVPIKLMPSKTLSDGASAAVHL
jgi:hypothetical protein